MKRVFGFLVVLMFSSVFAQEAAFELSFEEALNRAALNNASVATARVDLESATRDLSRVQQDPLSLRIPLLQAQQAVELATLSLEAATLSAQQQAASAYASAKEADTSLQLSQAQEAITATQLEANTIRFNAGAATRLDLERAQNALASAQRDTQDSSQARALAYDNLASLVGLSSNLLLTSTIPVAEVPSLETVLANLDANSNVIRAKQSVELAQANLAAVDNAFSSRSTVDAARDNVSNAETRLADTRRSLDISFRQSYNAVSAAQSRVASATANLSASQSDLNAQQVRFDAGSISLLELEQSKLTLLSANAQLESAQHALAATIRQLELAVKGGS